MSKKKHRHASGDKFSSSRHSVVGSLIRGRTSILILAILAIAGLSLILITVLTQHEPSEGQPVDVDKSDTVPRVLSARESQSLIDSTPDLLILDVRTVDEYQTGHIEGAVNHPLDLISQGDIEGLPLNRPLLVYCRTGVRSARAVQLLSELSFTDLYDLSGGITAWQSAGYPVVLP